MQKKLTRKQIEEVVRKKLKERVGPLARRAAIEEGHDRIAHHLGAVGVDIDDPGRRRSPRQDRAAMIAKKGAELSARIPRPAKRDSMSPDDADGTEVYSVREGSGDRNDPRNAQGNQKQGPGSDGRKGQFLEEDEAEDTALGYRADTDEENSPEELAETKTDKEWYEGQLFERLSRKWSK